MSESSLVTAAFEALPMEAAVLDADGAIVYTNEAWRKFGLENDASRDDWVGQNYLDSCDASDDPVADAAAQGLRAVIVGDRETFRLEYPCHSPDQQRWFILRAHRFERDGSTYLLVIHVNITERRLAELEVQESNEQLQTVTSVLSHDLRNPLGVARGYVDLLIEEVDSEELATVRDALERMERIIDDAIVLARGRTAREPAPVDLAEQAHRAWETVITDDAELVVEGSARFEADASLLRSLFENLFRNAVEHAGPAVTVTVTALDDGFAIADDGPGIPPDRREVIFEPGESGGDGTGLGLAIVRRVCEAHDWSVEVGESDDGGARFEIRGVDAVD